ncbi:MAG: hypothetical protein WCC84_05080 [Candidatus Cybelea sp.]
MLELINAITLGASLAIVVTVITTQAEVSWNDRRWAIAGILGWTALIVAGAATGHFTPGTPGIVIQPPAIFAVAIVALSIAWMFSAQFRRAMLSIPLQSLVGLNVLRVLGVFFVIEYFTHELAAPFGPVAGLGDTITGLVAIPLALSIARGSFSKSSVAWWNAFGALDLFTALALGALSQNGVPFRVFFGEPGLTAMTQLPSVIVPTILVPIYLLIHLTVAYRLGHAPARQAAHAAI